jgi:hypothetical protein
MTPMPMTPRRPTFERTRSEYAPASGWASSAATKPPAVNSPHSRRALAKSARSQNLPSDPVLGSLAAHRSSKSSQASEARICAKSTLLWPETARFPRAVTCLESAVTNVSRKRPLASRVSRSSGRSPRNGATSMPRVQTGARHCFQEVALESLKPTDVSPSPNGTPPPSSSLIGQPGAETRPASPRMARARGHGGGGHAE